MNRPAILLNADVGEGLTSDTLLYPYLDQASIACGGHAGTAESMRRAIHACLQYEVAIGAHPAYPDKETFGRVSLPLKKAHLVEMINLQIQALDQQCSNLRAQLVFVKPHGALYNDMMAQPKIFQAVLTAVSQYPKDLVLMIGAMPNALSYQETAAQHEVRVVLEAFADRRYTDDGQLQERTLIGAVYNNSDAVLTQVAEIQRGVVTTASGKSIPVLADSLCIHGDNPTSVEVIKAISKQLDQG